MIVLLVRGRWMEGMWLGANIMSMTINPVKVELVDSLHWH
jgi:hypothetical protein